MLGTVLDMGVAFVVGWVTHAYGWSWLVNKVKEKFAAVVKSAAEKQ